jgi:hypothetical protein
MTEESKSLMPQEKTVLALKYSAKRFGIMDEVERDLMANKAILVISLITGWTVPARLDFMDVLIEQFSKKMLESYSNLNIEEVEYAFRNKGLDIKDWGKALNLALIDEVLQPYLHNRADLSLQEEKISSQLPIENNEKQTEPMSDQEWDEWLQDIAKYKLNMIPCDSYEYLVRKEKVNLTKEEKTTYMDRAVNHIYQTIDPSTREGLEFLRMKEKGIFSPETTATLITISKRLVVFDYFNNNHKG